MSNTAYSDLKAAWYTDKCTALRRGEQIVPSQVQLIISDLCNHDCHFCAYRMSGGFSTEQFGEQTDSGLNMNPNRKIDTDKCLEILDDCKILGVEAIQFTGGGEPTVHPDHLLIFMHAQNIGLKTGLVTNGTLLRGGWENVLPHMEWVRVSVDAANAEQYASIRNVKPSMYHRAMDNISQLAEKIREGQTKCLLGVGYVITRENYEGLFEGIKRIKETGAHYVRLSAMFSELGESYYDGIYGEIQKNIGYLRTLETKGFKIVNLFGDRISDLKQHSPDYSFCGYQQFNMYIGGNLKVYRCCTTSYTKHGEVGDLSDKRLADWFYSQEKQEAYKTFNARSCHTCQFNNKNRVINYMVDKNPVHVEFV